MLKKVVLLFIFCTFVYSENKLDMNYYFGFSIKRLEPVHQNKIKSVAYRLEKEFEQIFDGEHDIRASFIENEKELIDDFVSYKEHNIIIIYSAHYLREKDRIKDIATNIYSFVKDEKFQKFIFIANKNSKINSLEDIKGKKYANFVESGNYSIWLDYLTLKELGTSYKKLIKFEKEYSEEKILILDIFFDKADFGIIRESTYADMLLLNPALKKKIKVIRESKPIFPYGLAFFHKNTPSNLIDKFNKLSEDGTFNKRFKHLFLLLNQTSFKEVPAGLLEEFESFHDEYKELKSK